MLLANKVDKILLNDADFSIYSFWYSIKYYGDEFLEIFDNTKVTLEEWKKQKLIFMESKKGNVDNILLSGFATFFLNRCNYSGILNAGPIGGKSYESQEMANYKIDARYNKDTLRKKLINVISHAEGIEVHNLDALTFLKDHVELLSFNEQSDIFVYLDPPYYIQGSSLYLSYYTPEDHRIIAKYLCNSELNYKWLLSYDNVTPIREFYKDQRQYSFYINYSANQNKLGSELLIVSNNSILPESKIIRQYKNNKPIELILF